MSIAENIRIVTGAMAEAAVRAGRDPSDVTLVAVTKTRTVDQIAEAVDAGIVHLGENRVQEAAAKIPALGREAVWHLVGPLQSNKARLAAALFDWIESVHSEKTARLLSARAVEAGKKIAVLLQVNISGEDAKSGVTPGGTVELARHVQDQPGLDLRGLMTIGSFGVGRDVTRSEFARMYEMFEGLKEDPVIGENMSELSMGMSGDYDIAIEEGATLVRVGTALFGERG